VGCALARARDRERARAHFFMHGTGDPCHNASDISDALRRLDNRSKYTTEEIKIIHKTKRLK
ncbi:MAG: hypothetical protein ACREP2_12470, partial [Rhodanobacteraceae bacterium]